MKVKKSLEIYEHSEKGVAVTVLIDYRNKHVDLVQYDPHTLAYKPKKWEFKNRGIEYMNGWTLILKVMQNAVKEAKDKLKENEDIEFAHKVNLATAMYSQNLKEGLVPKRLDRDE